MPPAASLDLGTMDGTNGFRLQGAAGYLYAGYWVAGAGDVNRDGYADFIIGAPRDGSDGAGAGFLVFGKATGWAPSLNLGALTGNDGVRLNGAFGDCFGGNPVAAAGDVNGDGYADVIIGAPYGGPDGAGAGYVVYGKASGWTSSLDLGGLPGTEGFRLDGVSAGDFAGCSVALAGDVNADGIADLLIGAPSASPDGRSNAGAGYVVFGKAGGWSAAIDLAGLNGDTGFRLDGIGINSSAGNTIAAAGDVNGDGIADLIIGAMGADPSGRNAAGSSYVVFGKASGWTATLDLGLLNGSNGFRLDGAAAFDNSGSSVASAGDVNGDGYADLIIGTGVACSYLVFGKATGWSATIDLGTLNSTEGVRLNAPSNCVVAAAAGDVNGDGLGDLIIGAQWAGPAGNSYLVYGKTGPWSASLDLTALNGSDGFRLNGSGDGENTGSSVASAGDVNGDGFADLVIGAPGLSPECVSYAGASYVVFGGVTGAVSYVGTDRPDNLTGGAFGDSLLGGAGDDLLRGNDGNDVLDGGDGNDSLLGGAGNDTLYGGQGRDTLDGGAGDDSLTADGDYSTLIGGAGNDRLIADGGSVGMGDHNTLDGGEGDDSLTGGRESTLIGGAGNDRLIAYGAYNTLVGGDGNDSLTADGQCSTLDGGNGDDTLSGGWSDTLLGGDGNDSLSGSGEMYGGDGNDNLTGDWIMHGGAGNDSLSGAPGSYLNGDEGDDTLTGSGDMYGGAGNDSLTGSGSLYGGDGNDILTGSGELHGGKGNDSLVGCGLGDWLTGDDGNDTLVGGDGVEADLYGGNGNDSLLSGNGNDWLEGGDGADTLDGGLGDDNLFGGGGADILLGGLGMDTLDGGGGIDTAVYGFASTGALTRNADGSWSVAKAGGETDHLIGIERVQFSDTTVVIRQPSSTDMTGDGFGDVLLQNATTGDVYLWGLDGTGLTKSGFVGWTPGADWRAAGTGDANGDGIADVLLQNTATGDCYLWALDGTTDGAGSVIASASGFVGWTPGAQWRAVGMADFNGDGLADALLQNSETGDCYLWQLDGTTLVGNGFAGWTPGAAWRAAGIGDFNADGMADIVLQNNETGDCYLWLMNGGTAGTDALAGAGYVGWRPPSADWHVRDTGDYNGDTRSDILLQDSVTGDCFAWLLDGTNVIGGGYVGWRPGAAWVAQRGGDMNGDGNADVLLRNSDTGESYVWQLDGTTVTGGGFVGWATSNEWQALG